MNVAYALIPEKCMLPDTKYHRLYKYTICLSYILTRDLRNDSSATNMLYVLKYKRREFYDGSVLLLLSITMLSRANLYLSFIYLWWMHLFYSSSFCSDRRFGLNSCIQCQTATKYFYLSTKRSIALDVSLRLKPRKYRYKAYLIT